MSECIGPGCTFCAAHFPALPDPAPIGTGKTTDQRLLFKLNHEERQAYKARLRSLPDHLRRTEVINLDTPILTTDADGTLIKEEEGGFLTLRRLVLVSLKAAFQTDAQQPHKVRMERHNLVKRIEGKMIVDENGQPVLDEKGKVKFGEGPTEIELTEAERNSILERAGKIYTQVGIIGRASELLAGEP